MFCDELAYADRWDLWLKTFYDEKWPVQIAGSSSSTAALRERRLESGVGRWEEQYLAPYLFTEYLSLVDQGLRLPLGASLDETLDLCAQERVQLGDLEAARRRFLLTGGFPELLLGAELAKADEATALLQSQRVLRTDAVERAIYKDIPQAFTVADPMLLERMLYVLAGQVAGVLSPQKLCQQLGGMSQPTFDKYLSYLERAFLVFSLPNYSGTETSVQRRGRKLYFVDGAVRNAALQRGVAPLSDQMEMGLLVENLVAGHLHALAQQTQVRLYHWREKDHEVDLIYNHPERPLAFEIGMSPRHSKEGIYQFAKVYPRFHGRCYMVAPNAQVSRPDENWDKVGTLPLDLLLGVLGQHAASALAERLAQAPHKGGGE
jgi:predicted AAA+ superfamily ATPase